MLNTDFTAAIAAFESKDYESVISMAAKCLANEPRNLDAFFLLSAAQNQLNSVTLEFRNSVAARNSAIYELQKNPRIFPGSISPEVSQLLYSLVRALRPHSVLEIGTLFGYSALCISQALKENDYGYLNSFDLFQPANYDGITTHEGDDRGVRFVQEQLISGHVNSYVTLHQGDSSQKIRDFAAMSDNFKVDLAFIDGSHFIKGVIKDFEAVDPLLNPNALIILHDTDPEKSGWLGPRYLAEKLKEHPNYRSTVIDTADTLGLAILQKISDEKTEVKWCPKIKNLLIEQVLFNIHFRFKLPQK